MTSSQDLRILHIECYFLTLLLFQTEALCNETEFLLGRPIFLFESHGQRELALEGNGITQRSPCKSSNYSRGRALENVNIEYEKQLQMKEHKWENRSLPRPASAVG